MIQWLTHKHLPSCYKYICLSCRQTSKYICSSSMQVVGFNLKKQSMFSQITAHKFSSHILVSLPSALPRPLLSSSPLHTPVTHSHILPPWMQQPWPSFYSNHTGPPGQRKGLWQPPYRFPLFFHLQRSWWV